MGKIDRDALRAPYQQLADILRAQIRAGEIESGKKLPSLDELMETYELSANTTKKAVDVLKDEGLVVFARGRGWFVAEQLPGESS